MKRMKSPTMMKIRLGILMSTSKMSSSSSLSVFSSASGRLEFVPSTAGAVDAVAGVVTLVTVVSLTGGVTDSTSLWLKKEAGLAEVKGYWTLENRSDKDELLELAGPISI